MQQFVPTAVVVTCSECAWFRLLIGERLSLRRSERPARWSLSGRLYSRRFSFRRANQFLIPINAASPSMDNVF